MTYREAEKRLLALGDEVLTMKFGLRNMHSLLAELGNPHQRFPSLHVAGTNGKGSVCAMLHRILCCSGRRVGLFTSPHLISIRERIRVNDTLISEPEFAVSYDRVARAIRRLRRTRILPAHPTYFETITALAFDFFARQKIDIAVLEVGMGGRLDSTNVVTPLVSVITNIDFDHERFLGNTIAAIAGEKAGIIKPRIPVLTAARRPDAIKVIRQKARQKKGAWHQVTRDSRVSKVLLKPGGSRFDLKTPHRRYRKLFVSLAGRHQIENAVLAIRTLEECRVRGFQISDEALVEGLASARWPGRFEKVSERPTFILDGAHNPAGALALRRMVTQLFPGRRVILIYGAMRDKAIRQVLKQLLPITRQLILTRPAIPRAAGPAEIFEMAGWLNKTTFSPANSFLVDSIEPAVRLARKLAHRRTLILIAGSLYLVGEARRILLDRKYAV
ncbi:MAG: bifunctional folylpolyglutamate synthase/dihydrofolate synthase [Acidobacteriia bacterium]|nr:bifunctional folylpolyglutamate synthase/dihydrofolate synthase [Terriglobia bacterium]